MKTWQRSLLCVLFCVVGLNGIARAAPLDIFQNIDISSFTVVSDNDVRVNPSSVKKMYGSPSMVSTPDGQLYVAYATSDPALQRPVIHLCRSTDNGLTWELFQSFQGNGWEVKNPSITYLETSTEKWVCIVYYEVSHDMKVSIGMARIDPENRNHFNNLTIASHDVSYYFQTTFPHPEICTDYPLETSDPFLYVTYPIRTDSFEYQVMAIRSTNLGLAWSQPQSVGFSPDVTTPDIEYGYAGLFVVYDKYDPRIRDSTTQIILKRFDNRGSNWNSPIGFIVNNPDISYPRCYRPRVSAGIGNPTVLVAYSASPSFRPIELDFSMDIMYSYSWNGGYSWVRQQPLAVTDDGENFVELGRNLSNGQFYAAYIQLSPPEEPTGVPLGDVRYTSTRYSMFVLPPLKWEPSHVINEEHRAIGMPIDDNKPGITVNPQKPWWQGVCFTWSDARDYFAGEAVLNQVYFGTNFSSISAIPMSPTSPFGWIGGSETMSYTVTVENIFEDLNTLTVTNQLSDLVTYTSGAVALNGVVQEPLAVTDGLWTYSTADLAYGDVLTFSFDVVVDAGIDPGDLISNLINVQYVYGLSNTLLEYSREVAVIVGNVPEPATWTLIGLGLLGGLLLRRKQRRV